MSPTFQPTGPASVELNIDVDVSAFRTAMDGVARTAARADAALAELGRWLGPLVAIQERRWRRHHTHVWEHPQASRMHAAYTAKTRRRNCR